MSLVHTGKCAFRQEIYLVIGQLDQCGLVTDGRVRLEIAVPRPYCLRHNYWCYIWVCSAYSVVKYSTGESSTCHMAFRVVHSGKSPRLVRLPSFRHSAFGEGSDWVNIDRVSIRPFQIIIIIYLNNLVNILIYLFSSPIFKKRFVCEENEIRMLFSKLVSCKGDLLSDLDNAANLVC